LNETKERQRRKISRQSIKLGRNGWKGCKWNWRSLDTYKERKKNEWESNQLLSADVVQYLLCKKYKTSYVCSVCRDKDDEEKFIFVIQKQIDYVSYNIFRTSMKFNL